ncbi:uncharacterized protein LOC125232230 isoform X2 [Leguminivora glycinivorella]|uniref:uncharacterized protein LOC125232230 isoform X2 n=1 Tax=Leguminivora glycinivorella TaxID=1035111 RepID=UPI00200BA715|nr:uncharacterized protein LOC125232230 isoform X2 [Leguminivora glycinivorella]
MRRARSVTGPLRRAHPASGATWNVQVVRGKMSSQCLWHACRALSAGLLLMLLGAAMAVIGYYADTLSVDQEVRGNATISVKDEARGFHLNNLSYAGPIVMGFGGFIVVAACVMTFEARDSAAKVTPARPQALPRPVPRRGPCAPARIDHLGVYRLPHVLPLPHSLPLAPVFRHRPPHSASASAAESECGSQSSLALDLHASGACAGVTLRVRDNTRRRPLARQQRLREDAGHTPGESALNVNVLEDPLTKMNESEEISEPDVTRLSVEVETRASSAPLPSQPSPPPSPRLVVTPCPLSPGDTTITIEPEAEPPPDQ